MKRYIFYFSYVVLTFVLLHTCSTILYAMPANGNTAVMCDLIIHIKDDTGGEYTGAISFTLTDIASGNQYRYGLSMQNYIFDFPFTESVIADTTYKMEFRFEDSRFALYDMQSGEAVERFHATASGYVADWVLKNTSVLAVSTTEPQRFVPISEGAGDEAAALWETFFNAVIIMDGDNAYLPFLNIYGKAWEAEHAKTYAKYTDGSAYDWLTFSLLERFMWYETYIRIIDQLHSGNYDMYFGSYSNFKQFAIRTVRDSLPRFNKEGAEAYENLMMWQYDYVRANSDVYNFITSTNFRVQSDEYKNFEPLSESEKKASEEQRLIEKDYVEIEKELIVEDLEENELSSHGSVVISEKDSDIWDKTIDKLKSLWFTIILLFVVAGALISVIVYRKRNDIKEIGSDS